MLHLHDTYYVSSSFSLRFYLWVLSLLLFSGFYFWFLKNLLVVITIVV